MHVKRFIGLVLASACALSIASGCGSSNPKKAVQIPSDGGEAGATPDAVGGAAGASEPGPGVAGEGGTIEPGAAGAAGAAGALPEATGGDPGIPPLECTPSGAVSGLQFDTEPTYSICRDSLALLQFSVTDSDQLYTCCGSTNAAYDVELAGLSNNDGGGNFTFVVPADAPLTEQSISADCGDGPVATSVAVKVTDTAPPLVTGTTTPEVVPNGTIVIQGSNLLGVDRVYVVPLDGGNDSFYCNIDEQNSTATSVSCQVSGGASPGEYKISLFEAYCGSLEPVSITVKPAEA
jgi:hypothetical protein